MNNLYEVLEICLNEIESGADMDTVLFRYPELADELRPIIETSIKAKEMTVPVPSQDIVKRNRAKVLQRASEMREQTAAPSRRIWSVPLRRALVSFTVIALLFVSGTNLVRASSTTLPGDNLYPVKRTWEDVLLLFTFDTTKREELEFEHENERLDELRELFAEGRSATVDFTGYVTRQNGTEWRVSGITVIISPETSLPDQPVDINAAVMVKGRSKNDMTVQAEKIELLPTGSKLPEVEDNELENDDEEHEGTIPQIVEDTNFTFGSETQKETPIPDVEPEDVSMDGIITSVEGDLIVVDGIVMDIEFTEIEGGPNVGTKVKVVGYYNEDGIFIVTKIEFEESSSSSGSSNNNTSSTDNDDDHNDDHNDNDNSNDND